MMNEQDKKLISGLQFLRAMLDWSVMHGGSSEKTSKQNKALWLIGTEAINADSKDVRLPGSFTFHW